MSQSFVNAQVVLEQPMFDAMLKSEISAISRAMGLEPAVLLAVTEVESGGRLGASINGRTEPLIRFEGHYFYRLLPQAKRNLAVATGLASSRAGKIKNPLRQVGRWKLLSRAQEIDCPAALASCSWGCGQVMGAHWRWLGYANIDALVAQARDGAAGQVHLMARYIEKAGLVEKLASRDWKGFARAYNGPAYRKNKYDVRMMRAYMRFRGVGGLENGHGRPARHLMSMLRMGSVGADVQTLQQNLSGLGYSLQVDGDFGPATERMLMDFQRENGLKPDGVFGPKTLEMLQRKLPCSS